MADKRTITIDDLWTFERLGAVSLAPTGTEAVAAVSSFSMDDNTSRASLWRFADAGSAPRRLTSCGDKDGQPQWSPTGDAIAFVARREQEGAKDETPQLYVIAPDGGEARRVARFAPGVEGFKWFPDGRRIAFVAWVWPDRKGTKAQTKAMKAFQDRKTSGYATSEAQYRFWDHNLPMGRVPHLHVVDIESGDITDLFESTAHELPRAEPSAKYFDIAPDGRHIVFSADPAAEKRIDNVMNLVEVGVKSRKFRTVAADAAWDFGAPRYSHDGTRIAFVAANVGVKHTMPGRLAVLQRGGAWEVLSDGWDHAVAGPLVWSADDRAIYLAAEHRGRNPLWRFDLASREAAVVVRGGWVQSFDVAGDVVATVADALSHPAQLHVQRGARAPVRVERFNDERLAGLRLGASEEVTVTGALGEPVQMWLTYPPRFDPKKTYPVLHNIHGGPHSAAADTFHYRWNTHVFAAQGYVVAGVNYHGSSGFGQAFLDSITHRWGELELQDVEAGTDWLLRQRWADPKRVFAAGGSYGGYMVAWMNGHVAPGRYQAYICHAGCFDWTAMFSDDAYTWHAKELGAWYWDDGAKVRSQSPSEYAGAMKTPTLVIHGALDYRVPDQQGLAYYNTLKAREVDARLLWFPDENHWILKPRNAQLWVREFFDWLRRHDPAHPRS